MSSTISHEPSGLSSSGLEHDARVVSSEHSEVAPRDIAVGVVIGRASEYFDYFVYGIASVLVFPRVFFPFAPRLDGTLYSFTVFALAFIARPIGTVIFMEIQRRWGRATKLTTGTGRSAEGALVVPDRGAAAGCPQ